WEHYYNWDRPHSSLGGKTPNEKYTELIWQTPLHEEVSAKYDPKKEHILVHAYNKNFAVKKLKQSL
ncbi:MAG TPA: IS481 family transposase, partial [Chitinophagaceae bacterium]|nr:IS481 family transposase [Chitinophagaceae bacterium]